jgi:hypothetical protein
MRHSLHTEIDIEATPDVVWDVLTDLDRYADWNPFITSSSATLEVGETMVNVMQAPGGKAMTIKPRITELENEKTFEWLGSLGFRGVFDGRHRFEIHPATTGTRLMQSETFSGVLVRLLRKALDTKTKAGFEAMNVALKTRAESVHGG